MKKFLLLVVLVVSSIGCRGPVDSSTLKSVGLPRQVTYIPGGFGSEEKTQIVTDEWTWVVLGHVSVQMKSELYTGYSYCRGCDSPRRLELVQDGHTLGAVH